MRDEIINQLNSGTPIVTMVRKLFYETINQTEYQGYFNLFLTIIDNNITILFKSILSYYNIVLIYDKHNNIIKYI